MNQAALQANLIQNGYLAPGVEKVSSGPSHYELRYYYEVQAEEAKTLAASAATLLGFEVKVAGPLRQKFNSLPQQTMEFWFPRKP